MSDAFQVAAEGYHDARSGEPLFPDADAFYAIGWCIFHKMELPDWLENTSVQCEGKSK